MATICIPTFLFSLTVLCCFCDEVPVVSFVGTSECGSVDNTALPSGLAVSTVKTEVGCAYGCMAAQNCDAVKYDPGKFQTKYEQLVRLDHLFWQLAVFGFILII